MKIPDKELEELVYSVLRRCPVGDDLDTARKIVDTIIEVELLSLEELRVRRLA